MQNEQNTEDVPSDALERLFFSEITLTVLNPEENGNQVRDLSFLDSLQFSIGEGDDKTPVATSEADAFAAGTVSYTFPDDQVELLPFFAANDTLELSADAELGDRPNFETTIKFFFEVKATVKGF